MSKFTGFVILLVILIVIGFGGLLFYKNQLVVQQAKAKKEELLEGKDEFEKTQKESIPESVDSKTQDAANKIKTDEEEAAKEIEKTDDVVEFGDTAIIDYIGVSNGEIFEGGTADGFSLQIGSNNFIAGFEYQLIGAKVGDVVEVKVTFPEEYQSEDLQGKDAIFIVTVQGIEKL